MDEAAEVAAICKAYESGYLVAFAKDDTLNDATALHGENLQPSQDVKKLQALAARLRKAIDGGKPAAISTAVARLAELPPAARGLVHTAFRQRPGNHDPHNLDRATGWQAQLKADPALMLEMLNHAIDRCADLPKADLRVAIRRDFYCQLLAVYCRLNQNGPISPCKTRDGRNEHLFYRDHPVVLWLTKLIATFQFELATIADQYWHSKREILCLDAKPGAEIYSAVARQYNEALLVF